MAEVRVTNVGAYVELDPTEAVRVTNVGAYVELVPGAAARVTSLGAYLEMLAKEKEDPGPGPPKPPKPPKPPRKPKFNNPVGDPAAWWPASVSVGSKILEDVVASNDGVMAGTVPWLVDGAFGIAVDADGNSANYFNAGPGKDICDADMSISAWVSFDSLSTSVNDYEVILARSKSGSDSYVLGVKCYTDGAWPRVFWSVGGVDMFAGAGREIVSGEVYHIVVTGTGGVSPGTWDLFVDGTWDATSGSSGAIPFNGTDTYIGRREWATEEGEMDGKIYDLRAYSRPLATEEVALLYSANGRWADYKPAFGYFESPIPPEPESSAAAMAMGGLSGLSAIFG